MARRQRTLRVDSKSVQGKESYVEFRKYTWGERKELQASITAIRDAQQAQKTKKKEVGENEDGRPDESLQDYIDLARAQVLARLVDWNWVDDEGKALPLPKTEADLEPMLDDENGFLLNVMGDIILGKDVDDVRKN